MVNTVYPVSVSVPGMSDEDLIVPVKHRLEKNHIVMSEQSQHAYVVKIDLQQKTDIAPSLKTAHDTWQLTLLFVPMKQWTQSALPQMQGVGFINVLEALPSAAQIEQMAQMAIDEIQQQVRLLKKASEKAVQQALHDPSPRIKEFALRLIVAKHFYNLVPLLCTQLNQEEDVSMMLKMIGVLVQLKDKRAVTPLIELAQKKDPIFVTQLIFAIASIGGTEAEAYLDTVSHGHPNEDIQRSAHQALQELLHKKQPIN